jgi:nucleotide-binding universal stress UspA family protein
MMYQNVLVPLKGSDPLESILPHVEAMSQKGLVKTVTFIQIVSSACLPSVFASPMNNNVFTNEKIWEETAKSNLTKAIEYMEKLVSSLNFGETFVKWDILPTDGIVASIKKYVIDNGVDFIIMTTLARSGISRWIWGNKAEQVLQIIDVPVLMIKIPEDRL